MLAQFTEDCIEAYDRNPPTEDRPDFMGWLRQVKVKGDRMLDADFLNHFSNNLVLFAFKRDAHL